MKNLDQIRAHNALLHKDRIANSQGGGDAISGFPMLVLTDGLLAAITFACEEKEIRQQDMPAQNAPDAYLCRQIGNGQNARYLKRKHPGEYTVARALAEHLRTESNCITTSANADALIADLSQQDSDILLRRATGEALAFLNYLKRFVA
jgi:CRISPR/Cas system CMR-associated protein Cmr5 small subunit